MKLKLILVLNLLIIGNIICSTNNIQNYFDLAEIEENSDKEENNPVRIKKEQIVNFQVKYFNKNNKQIRNMPINIFAKLLHAAAPGTDEYTMINFISIARKKVMSELLKDKANHDDINNQRLIDITIISTYTKNFSNTIELAKKNQGTKEEVKDCITIVEDFYSVLSEKQKNLIIDVLRTTHKEIFKSETCLRYPQSK